MHKIIAVLFLISVGHSTAQVTYHASISLNYKMSFSRLDDSEFEPLLNQDFPNFSYSQTKNTFYNPRRLSLSAGLTFNRHRFNLGMLMDGVCNKYVLTFENYDPVLEGYRPNKITGASKTVQKRVFLNYDFLLIHPEKKTNLFISASIGLCSRGGPLGIGPVGTMGSGVNLDGTSKILELTSAGYTAYDKYAMNIGGGIGTDIYHKGNYILTLSSYFTYSPNYLYFKENTVRLADNGTVKTYEFRSYATCSGLYFGITRRFQLHPWQVVKEKWRNYID